MSEKESESIVINGKTVISRYDDEIVISEYWLKEAGFKGKIILSSGKMSDIENYRVIKNIN